MRGEQIKFRSPPRPSSSKEQKIEDEDEKEDEGWVLHRTRLSRGTPLDEQKPVPPDR